jgi:hypothetical protein
MSNLRKGYEVNMKLFDRLFSKEASDVEVLQAQNAVGDQFKQWLSSDIGRYIVGRAEQHELATLKKLRETDPKDTVTIIKLQAESGMPGKLLEWIEEAITMGDMARYQLEELEDEEER